MIYNVPALASKAYYRFFTPSNIVSSFQKTGIYTLNRLAFGNEDFASSFFTDHEFTNSNENEKYIAHNNKINSCCCCF